MHISAPLFLVASLAASSAGVASASDVNKMLRAKVDLPEAEMRSLIASKAKSAEKLSTLLQFLKDQHESNRFLQGDAVPELYEGDGDAPPGFGFDFGDVDLGDLAGSFDLCGKDNDLEFMGTTCSCSLRSADKEYSGLMDIIGDFSHVMENGRKCIASLSTSYFIFSKKYMSHHSHINCCNLLCFPFYLFLFSRRWVRLRDAYKM